MNKKEFIYRSDEFDRQSQRFVNPLFKKDSSGTYHHSSTGTFVKYNEHHYMVFAAHAIEEDFKIDDFYFFLPDGTFKKIIESSLGYYIYEEDDIVIIDYFNIAFQWKNYFNLNLDSMIGFNKNIFAWIGFPHSKCKIKKIHKIKSTKELKDDYIVSNSTGLYSTAAEYRIIISKIDSKNKYFIQGKYNRKNTDSKYKGKISVGTHPRGMSGGAMYFFSKHLDINNALDNSFRFAGIGIEYRDNIIKGVAKDRIIELIKKFDLENPIEFNILDEDLLINKSSNFNT